MFGFRKFIKLTAVAAAALIMASCGKDPQLATKGNMVPDGAVLAMKLNADQLFNKALGAENSQTRQLWNMGKSMASMSLSQFGELGNVALQILNDPAALGACIEEPVVISFYVDFESAMTTNNPDVEMYLVALLENKAAFEKVVDTVIPFAEQEGMMKTVKDASEAYTHYILVDDDDVSLDLGVTNESAVFRFKAGVKDAGISMKDSMVALFANKESADSEGLDAFYASEGELAMWFDMETCMNAVMPLMASVQPESAAQINELMPMLANASFVTDLSFLEGQTVLGLQVFGSQEMKDYSKKYNAVPSGKFLKYMPASSAIVGSAAIKNLPELMDQMCGMNPEFAELFDELEVMFGVDKDFLAGISGDIAFALDGKDLGLNEIPGFMVAIECERNIWDFVQEEIVEEAHCVGSDMYNIMNVAYLAYMDGHIVLADPDTMSAVSLGGTDSFAETALAKEIQNGGVVMNLEALPIPVLDMFAKEIDANMSGEELLDFVSSVVVASYNDNMSAKLILNMGDKQHNFLEKLINEAVAGLNL